MSVCESGTDGILSPQSYKVCALRVCVGHTVVTVREFMYRWDTRDEAIIS